VGVQCGGFIIIIIIPLLHLWAFVAFTRVTFTFTQRLVEQRGPRVLRDGSWQSHLRVVADFNLNGGVTICLDTCYGINPLDA